MASGSAGNAESWGVVGRELGRVCRGTVVVSSWLVYSIFSTTLIGMEYTLSHAKQRNIYSNPKTSIDYPLYKFCAERDSNPYSPLIITNSAQSRILISRRPWRRLLLFRASALDRGWLRLVFHVMSKTRQAAALADGAGTYTCLPNYAILIHQHHGILFLHSEESIDTALRYPTQEYTDTALRYRYSSTTLRYPTQRNTPCFVLPPSSRSSSPSPLSS